MFGEGIMIVSWILLAVFIIEVILLFVVTAGMRKKKIKTRDMYPESWTH